MDILRGDIFFVRKAITEGNEQDAGRPAVIVSNDIGNQHANIVEVVYLTSQEKKPMPTHVEVLCKVPSVALCEQICTVSKDRLGDLIRSCTIGEMKEIDKALMISLGIESGDGDSARLIDSKNSEIEELKCHIEALKKDLCETKKAQSNTASAKDVNVAVNYATVLGERNIYKTMYEQLLEKVILQKGC